MEQRPKPGDKVRHISTGDRGVLHRYDQPLGAAHPWALVDWPAGGPGMVGPDGYARVAPTLLRRA